MQVSDASRQEPDDLAMASAASGSDRGDGFGVRFVLPLALGATLNPINSTMISVGLVGIAREFDASAAATGWLIAGLYLTSAVAQPSMGRLADLFGPRKIYLISLGLVALAGLAGHWAPSLAVLIGVRILLGAGTSAAYPAAMRLFHEQARRLGAPPPRVAMGYLSLAGIASVAVGPVLGGVLTGWFGWRSIFVVNLPLALATIVLVLLWVPRDAPRTVGGGGILAEIDVGGIALFAGMLLSAMLFLMRLDRPPWPAVPLALAFAGGLVVHSRRRPDSFIDVRMLARNRALTATYARMAGFMLITYCILYGFTQWVEVSVGLNATTAGVVILPMSLVAAASSLIAARVKGIRLAFLIGSGAALAGCVALALVDRNSSLFAIAAAAALFGIPQGMVGTATQAAIFVQAPADKIGTAAGLQRTAGYMGAIGAAALLGRFFGTRPSDSGLHHLVLVVACLSVVLLVATIFDRTLGSGTVARRAI